MLTQLRNLRDTYPRQFWVLFIGMLVMATGVNLIFPFISLYLTGTLNFSMTAVGILIAAFWGTSMISQVISGELVDKIGRKPVMIFSLVCGGLATLLLGLLGPLLNEPGPFHVFLIPILVLLLGVSAGLFYPAANTMTADLISGEKRTQAYGLLRTVYNLGIAIGPAIGGLIASQSYMTLFISAAVAFLLGALLFGFFTQETHPHNGQTAHILPDDGEMPVPLKGNYSKVLQDKPFVAFNLLYAVSMLAYSQMNTTLPVYLQGYGISEAWYGLMMSLNAVMVVMFQYPLTRRIGRYASGLMMAVGSAFFAVGFGLFGFVSTIPLFFLGQALWTVGEMITTPISQAFVADVAPAASRGRYMGFYGLSWGLAYGMGPLLGGLVLDRWNGHFIWYGALLLNGLVALSFVAQNHHFVQLMAQRKNHPTAPQA